MNLAKYHLILANQSDNMVSMLERLKKEERGSTLFAPIAKRKIAGITYQIQLVFTPNTDMWQGKGSYAIGKSSLGGKKRVNESDVLN